MYSIILNAWHKSIKLKWNKKLDILFCYCLIVIDEMYSSMAHVSNIKYLLKL